VIKSTIGDSTSVGTWLGSLDKSQQDAFKHYAKNAASDIEAYLYARFLKPGYGGSIADLTAWVQEKYPKEDLRKILLIEIDSLKTDLHNVRQMTLTGMLDHATAATKIAVLQKEIRSHIQAPKQYRIGIKGFERMNRCLQVSEERNHRDDENDDIRRTQNLP
jgi:hypothetical protein